MNQLESLPRVVLLEVLSYIHHKELLDVRFLNKSLFGIISLKIKEYLRHSTYSYNIYYKEVQNDFIKQNSSSIKHLIISNSKHSYIPNAQAIMDFISNNKFTRVKSMHITIYKEDSTHYNLNLIILKDILLNVETIKIGTDSNIILRTLFSLLNPTKLKSIIIVDKCRVLDINDILKCMEFRMLEKLEKIEIYSCNFNLGYNQIANTNTIIFPSIKALSIYGIENFNEDFNMFEGVTQLTNIDITIPGNSMKIAELIKRNSLLRNIHLELNCTEHGLTNIDGILGKLEPFLNIKNDISLEFMIWNLDLDFNSKDVPLFLSVYKITFFSCWIKIQSIFNLLKYFPNVKVVMVQNSQIYNHQDQPILKPGNPKDFIFCIDKSVFYKSEDLNLLRDINTYIIN